jgi:hypothetical protein
MAVYWNAGILTRTREQADACATFFAARQLRFGDRDVTLEVWRGEIADGFAVGVWPRGMSYGSPRGNDPELVKPDASALIAAKVEALLIEAPPFAVAVFTGEAFDMLVGNRVDHRKDASGLTVTVGDARFADVLPDLVDLAKHGLVVDGLIWEAMGKPAGAKQVGPDRFAWPRSSPA